MASEGSDSKLRHFFDQFMEKLEGQQWFQQLKAKWDELDPMAKLYAKLGGALGTLLLIFIFVFGSMLQVRSLKKELEAKIQLRMVIQSATEEMRALRAKTGGLGTGGGDAGGWQQAVKTAATNAGIDETSLEIGPDKPGDKKGSTPETLVEVKAKRISIKQLVRYAMQIETGSTPAKLRNLTVQAEDPEGYMDVTLALSIFEPKAK